MPEQLIRDLVIRNLKDIDYDRENLSGTRSYNYLLKNYLLGMRDDIEVTDDDTFEVEFPSHVYSEIVYTECYYGFERIKKQYDSVVVLSKNRDAPKAWLLVTTYYHSFFCAVLLSRILGRWSCYFNEKDIGGIIDSADNPSSKSVVSGNYVGYFISSIENTIKIRFKAEGDRPHYTAWKNLCDKVPSSGKRGDLDAARLRRVQLFKSIINEGVRGWPLPSEVRNLWNYSDMFLYLKKGDDTAKEFSAMIDSAKDIEWASRSKLYPTDSNIATSIAFISSTLKRSLDICSPKILG